MSTLLDEHAVQDTRAPHEKGRGVLDADSVGGADALPDFVRRHFCESIRPIGDRRAPRSVRIDDPVDGGDDCQYAHQAHQHQDETP